MEETTIGGYFDGKRIQARLQGIRKRLTGGKRQETGKYAGRRKNRICLSLCDESCRI